MPVHSAQPIASSCQGAETGRGARCARPLPAHSIITAIVTAGRARSSSRLRRLGCARSPSTTSSKGAGVEVGDVEVDEHVVHADRRDRAAQSLERHARVAQREPDFVAGEPGVIVIGMA